MPGSKHTKILTTNPEYSYQPVQYVKFLQLVLNFEDLSGEFANEVDALQLYDKQVRDEFAAYEKRVTTHPNHIKAFEQLAQSQQYQLDCIDALIYHIITTIPAIDPAKRTSLQVQIEREEIFINFLKTHYEVETDYAALKDRQESAANKAELKRREKVISQLRKTLSDVSKVFADLKKCKPSDSNKYKHLSEQLDTLIINYHQQKSDYDATSNQHVAREQLAEHVVSKKAVKPIAEMKKQDNKQKKLGFLNKIKRGTEQAAHNLKDVVIEVGSAVLVKPSQKIVTGFVALLPQNDQPLDPKMQISTPNGTQEYDQILLDEKSPIDAKYKKALEDKIGEIEKRTIAAFPKEEKPLAEKLLVIARAYLAKINMHSGSSNIEEIVGEEKKSFLQAIHALLFPQLKQINLQTLKKRLEDLEREKRLIEKLTTNRDKEKRAQLFAVMDTCYEAIKKARKKIKGTKSYGEIKIITGALAKFKDDYKRAKAEFDKYLAENTAAPTYLPSAALVTPQSAVPAASNSADKQSAEGIDAGNDTLPEHDVADETDDSNGSDSEASLEALTASSSTPLSVGSQTPSPSLSRSSSQSPAHSSPRSSEDLTDEQAEITRLAALELELKKKAEAGNLEEQALIDTIQRLEREALERQHAQLDAEYRAAQQAANEARRVADELVAQNSRAEQARLVAIQKAEEEARLSKVQKAEEARRAKEVEDEWLSSGGGVQPHSFAADTYVGEVPNKAEVGASSSTDTSSVVVKSDDDFQQVPLEETGDQVPLLESANIKNKAESAIIAKAAIEKYLDQLTKEINDRVLPSFLYTGTKTYKLKEFKKIKEIEDPDAFFAAIEAAKNDKNLVTGWISDRSRILLDNIGTGKIDKDHPERAMFKNVEKEEIKKTEKPTRSCCLF